MTIQQQNVIAALIGHMEVSNNNVTLGAFWSISIIFSCLSSFLSKWDSIHSCDVRSRVILTSKKSKLSLLMVSPIHVKFKKMIEKIS